MIVVGLDPGIVTGVAVYHDGQLHDLYDVTPADSLAMVEDMTFDLLVFEDSRQQSHVWNVAGLSKPAAIKVARDIGRIDMQCSMLEFQCLQAKRAFRAISPEHKGAKLGATSFNCRTGWTRRSNQHQRDAAMAAYPFRYYRGAA